MSQSKRNFWVELKRRSVYQVATVYIVSAWIIIQVAVAIFPSLDVPEWILSLLIKVVILGFPVTLIFSWIFEITTKGIEITKYDGDIEEDRATKKIYVTSMILFSILVAFSLGFAYFAFFRTPDPDPQHTLSVPPLVAASVQPNSLAVLPFQNNSKDQDDYFSDGMMIEILQKLFAIDGLALKSRTSTNKYKGNTEKSIREIAGELGVAYILEGTITTHPTLDRVRINISLVDGQLENYIWTYNEENDSDDIFAVQSEIAQRVADHLKIELTQEEVQRLDEPSTIAAEPWKLFMRAQWVANNLDDYDDAMRLVDEALKLDPNFADAYAFKGYLWLARGTWLGQAESAEVIANAQPLLNRAKQINPSYPMTHVFLAALQLWFYWDFEAASAEWDEFFRLNPSNPPDPGYVDFLNASGRFDEAVDYSLKILSTDHNIPDSWGTTGLSYFFNGSPQEAITHYEEALRRFPDVPAIISDAARTYLYAGKYDRVIELLETTMNDIQDGAPRTMGNLAIAFHHTGEQEKSDQLLQVLKQRAATSSGGSPAFYTAMVLAQKNQIEEAFDYLQRAYKNREVEMFWLKVEPPFEPLKEDLRWFGLLQRIGFR